MPISITASISEDTQAKMELYKRITGKDVDIDACIRESICMYVPSDGIYKEGIFLRGESDYEKAVAQNEGREAEVADIPCVVLSATRMFGRSYFKIYCEDRIIKVPADKVRFNAEE